MSLKITSFEARYGDAFLIEESCSGSRFIVDCGFKLTYKTQIKKRVNSVDFIILTHSDEDHINGAFPLIEDYPKDFQIGKIYVNSPESIPVSESSGPISIRQAKSLIGLLQENAIPFEGLIEGQLIQLSGELSLEIMSPTQAELNYYYEEFNNVNNSVFSCNSDTDISLNTEIRTIQELAVLPDSFKQKKDDIANASSIAFTIHYQNKKILFLADSHPEVISEYLIRQKFTPSNKAKFEYIKLSHHGSAKSISKRLLSLISCNNFIVSTNGGKAKSKHPSVETIAKLATLVDRNNCENINFYFNYSVASIEARNGPLLSTKEQEQFKINYIEQNEIILP